MNISGVPLPNSARGERSHRGERQCPRCPAWSWRAVRRWALSSFATVNPYIFYRRQSEIRMMEVLKIFHPLLFSASAVAPSEPNPF